MNRNRKGVMPEVTREIYKNVKKFDRQQFTGFCKDLYGFGYEDGRDSVPGVDRTQIYEIIAGIKGIGNKRLEEIKEKVEAVFQENEERSNT